MEASKTEKVKEAKSGQMLQHAWELKQNKEKGRRASQRGESQTSRGKGVMKLTTRAVNPAGKNENGGVLLCE